MSNYILPICGFVHTIFKVLNIHTLLFHNALSTSKLFFFQIHNYRISTSNNPWLRV